jgi:hypothetical protein
MQSHSLWNSIRYDNQTGCWNWTHYKNPKGYGTRWYNRKKEMVHRIAMHLWRGFDLKSPLLVLHHCDNPPCFNPKHLFVGTALMNSQDAKAKGRLLGQPKMDPNRTHCANGHAWIPENLYRNHCKICQRISTRNSRQRKKEATVKKQKTTCKRGHAWIPENRYRGCCKLCSKENVINSRRRKRNESQPQRSN